MKSFLAVLAFALPVVGADISGYVYTPDGNVLEGKTVRAGEKSAVTDKDGGFVIGDLPAGVVELEVDATKVLGLTRDVVTITLRRGGAAGFSPPDDGLKPVAPQVVKGRVLLDGKPLANAPVFVQAVPDRKELVRAISNAKGEFVANVQSQQMYAVLPDARLFPRVRYVKGNEPAVVDLRKAREASIDVELASAKMVRGRVVDSEGKPVPRTRVLLVHTNRSALDFPFLEAFVRTMPDGRFAFPAPGWADSEEVQVAVSPAMQSTARSKPFRLGAEDSVVDITLPKVENVRVRVVDRGGKPIPRARIAFLSSVDSAALGTLSFVLEGQVAPGSLTVNDEGELMLRLSADSYDFIAAAEGFQTRTLESKPIARAMTVDIVMQQEALLRGRVRRGDRGVDGVTVRVDEETPGPPVIAFTDSDGAFEITGLAPGRVSIQAYTDELTKRIVEAEVPGDVDIELPPNGTLRVRVVDSVTSEPVREVAYTIARDNENEVHRNTETTDGSFTIEMPVGSYRVSAGAPGYLSHDPKEVHIAANETASLELPLGRGVVVSGRVFTENNLPIAGATVMMNSVKQQEPGKPREGLRHAETDEKGSFTLSGVEPGPVNFSVRKQGYVAHMKTIQAEGTMSLDVQLTRGLSLRGLVTMEGKPVAGVQIDARSSTIQAHQAAITDDEGRFTLAGLIRAEYSITAYHESSHSQTRDVDPTKQDEIVIALDPKGRGVVYGTVTGIPQPPAGDKYARRMVMLNGEDESEEAWIDDAGNYRIEQAPSGSATIVAHVEFGARAARTSAPKSIDVPAGQQLRVDLDLGANVRVSGRVTLDGKTLTGARVGFLAEDGMFAGTQTREDGTYELMLAPGLHQISATAELDRDHHYRTTREIRGNETIDFDLRSHVIEGTIIDAATRQPIAGAMIAVVPHAGSMAFTPLDYARTLADGRFRIATTFSDPHRLIVTAEGYAHRTQPVASIGTQYTFELSPASDLAVRVIDSQSGAPLEARVIVSDESGYLPMKARVSDDGLTHLLAVAPGTYRVSVFVGNHVKVVEATAPGAVEVTIE